ncbi:hypothetical protein Cflav_PD4222 [Pedosphaera parvula Ellin514]|uniref:Uncharacterized protein n=1 Tax=Pedosphaera parvula (strain Ellin514) TaxID=320771 RepID=B9XF46_PEDPL|nr:hypothetical protein Cflav_PD4222 [Pedosphaera parvula Ellin514]
MGIRKFYMVSPGAEVPGYCHSIPLEYDGKKTHCEPRKKMRELRHHFEELDDGDFIGSTSCGRMRRSVELFD